MTTKKRESGYYWVQMFDGKGNWEIAWYNQERDEFIVMGSNVKYKRESLASIDEKAISRTVTPQTGDVFVWDLNSIFDKREGEFNF